MKRLVMALALVPFVLGAQDILEVIDNAVIIHSGREVGKVGDEKWIVRESDQGVMSIGRVKINKSVQNMLVADITSVKPGYEIGIGDQIASLDPPHAYGAERAVHAVNYAPVRSDPYLHNYQTGLRRLRFGMSAGAIMPYEALFGRLHHSYQIGALLQYAFTTRSALLLDAVYSLRDQQVRVDNRKNMPATEERRSIFNVNAVFRQGVFHSIYMDVGAGIYIPKLSVNVSSSEREINSFEYFYGVCGGVAVGLVESGSFSIYFVPRYHAYLAKTELVENLTGGLNIIF